MLFFLFYSSVLVAQNSEFICHGSAASPLPTDQARMQCVPNSFGDIDLDEAALLPGIIVNVNFHFIADNNGNNFTTGPDNNLRTNANHFVTHFLNEANRILTNIRANPITPAAPPGVEYDYIGDSRIRVERYSEGAGDDNGIWFWDSRNDYNNSTFPYDDKVLHIVIDQNGTCSREGAFFDGTCGTSDRFEAVLWNAFPNALSGPPFNQPCDSDHWNYARLFLHELGHAATLTHAWFRYHVCSVYPEDPPGNPQGCTHDNNPRLGRGIDPGAECNEPGLPCGSLNPNGAGAGCDAWNSGSNNMMAGNAFLSGLSKCQWGIIYSYLRDVCYTDVGETTCVENSTPKRITQDETWNTERLMNRTVVIEEGVTLTITCKVSFTPSGSIRVNNGGTLIVDEGLLTKLCDDYWRGIVINNTSGDAGSGTVITRNNAVIEYARLGIDARRDGIVQCTDTEFRNNRKGAAFLNNKEPRNAFFVDCEFYSDDNDCSDGTCGHTGVSMWQNRGIYFSGCTFRDLRDYGIFSVDADYFVLNGSEFRNLPEGINAAGNYPFPVGPNAGIVIFGEAASPPFVIPAPSSEANNFEECGIAVNAASVFTLHVRGNTFNCNMIGTQVNGASEYWIHRNAFNNHKWAINTMGSFSGALNRIWCNEPISVAQNGIRVIGNNDRMVFDFNDFQNTTFDLHMYGNPSNPARINNSQGSIVSRASNKFSGAPTEISSSILPNLTFPFEYFPPEDLAYFPDCDNSGQFCNNLNNYQNALPQGNPQECQDNDGGLFVKPATCNDLDCFYTINQAISNIQTNSEDDSSSNELDSLYQIRLELRDSLITEYYTEENYSVIETMLLQSGFHEDLMLLGNIQVIMKKYFEAQSMIDFYEDENLLIQEYMGIHQININELVEPNNTLSSEAIDILNQIASNNTLNSGYAIRVLNREEERAYKEELPEEGTPTECNIQFRSTKVKSDNSQLNEKKEIKIFPNPTEHRFKIQFEDVPAIEVYIYDITGKNIYNLTKNKNQTIQVNTESWAAGIYFCKMKMAGEKIETRRVVIQK